MEQRTRTVWRDVAVPAALVGLGAAELAWLGSPGWLVAVGLEALAALALVFRRTRTWLAAPVTALLLMALPLTGTRIDEAATPIFFLVLATYSLGRYLGLRGGVSALVVTLAIVAVDLVRDPGRGDPTDVVFVLALSVPPYAFGRVGRRLAEQSRLLEEQGEQLRERAVRDERDRIAREMHDVIAHSISAMVVQTAAAQDLVHTQPERAAALLAQVAAAGRAALAETGRLLHLVRDDADELGLRPAPGVADLHDLVASLRGGGVDVDADVRSPEGLLSGAVDVTAYRVVQEALTNAARHGAGEVRLTVAAEDDVLRICCANPVAGPGAGDGSGLGLQGMAERVALVGGTLRHGTEHGAFVVRVELPLVGASP